MVPSGTALPLQSRTGSVSSAIFFPSGLALILIAHGSPGICWITRTADTPPALATKCAAPSLGEESRAIQAAPFLVCADRFSCAVLGVEISKFTGVDFVARFL